MAQCEHYRSRHCDGSIHMLSDNIDIRVMLGMVTFNGHEPITDAAVGK